MARGERLRVVLCFGLLGVAALLIIGRLFQLQALHRPEDQKSLRRQAHRYEVLPLARGTILDRNDRPLAEDRPVIEVRVEVYAKIPAGHRKKALPESFVNTLASRLAAHLAADPLVEPDKHAGLRTGLARRLSSRAVRRAKDGKHLRVEMLVSTGVESIAVVERLRDEQRAWNQKRSNLPGRLYFTFTKRFKRCYPDRQVTHGLVGQHGEQIVRGKSGRKQVREIATGIEAVSGLWPDRMVPAQVPDWYPLNFKAERKSSGFLRRCLTTPRRGTFWTGWNVEPPARGSVKTTLDCELQRAAHEELVKACAAVQAHYESPAGWGAMVLIKVPEGDVLALASHHPAQESAPAGASLTPLQNLHEPGSVVKPLLLAIALQRGVLSWSDQIDCTPNTGNLGWQVPDAPRRVIRDDHPCGVLSPHGVIVNSSNIGAVQIGLRLGRKGLQAYLDSYSFGQATELGLPYEAKGGQPKSGRLDKVTDKQLQRFTAPSLSFGYEVLVTPVQLARAYLRLLTGERRELRLFLSFAKHGDQAQPVRRPRPERFLDPAIVKLVRGAMTEVVSDTEGATGRNLHAMLVKLGYSGQVIAGKTGTSVSPQKRPPTVMKTASFVGCAPAGAPRYLVVCVLQKERATRFYGGRYAAPAAGRLLLRCLEQERRNTLTRSSGDGSGVGSASSVRASGRGTQGRGVRSKKGRSND